MNVAQLPIGFNIPVFHAPPAQGSLPDIRGTGGVGAGPLAPAPRNTFKLPEKSHPLNALNLTGKKLKVIGAGVGGEVGLFDVAGKTYIVKAMHGEAERTMFEKEVAAFRQLKPHPNICAPKAVATLNGKPSMLFDSRTIPSTTIATRAASLSPTDQLALLEIYARDLLKGMGALHDRDIAHGDVKAANTVVDPDTLQIKVIDLGHSTVASAADPRTAAQVLRRRSGHSGDPGYTSPELDHPERGGNRMLTAQQTLQSIDVYAVGRSLEYWLAHVDKRFEEVHGGKPSADKAASSPDIAKWMERRKRLGDVAAQMLKTDPGERPVVQSALRGLTPASPTDRVQGRKVLAQLVAAEKADDKQPAPTPSK